MGQASPTCVMVIWNCWQTHMRWSWSNIFVAMLFVSYNASVTEAAFGGGRPSIQEDAQAQEDPLQAAKDKRTVETLLRLPGFDIQAKPHVKASLDRYLRNVAGTQEYIDIVKKLNYMDAAPELFRMALQHPEQPLAVDAVRTLLDLGQTGLITEVLDAETSTEDGKALPNVADAASPLPATIQVLGRIGNQQTVQWLLDVIRDSNRPASTRTLAVRSIARSRLGEQELLKLAEAESLDGALKFAASDVLHTSRDPKIVDRIEELLPLPAGANSTPLPPIAELVAMKGDAAKGKTVFAGAGTCQKCHKVRGDGKEVGPDLSEIGSKLSRTALYESILDPSAAISHNYERYLVSTIDGTVLTGLLISETNDQIVLKDAESVVHTIPRDDIEDFLKQEISLMPVGLQKELSIDQLVDLVSYLSTLTKPGE